MADTSETLKAGFHHIKAEAGLSRIQVLKAYGRYRPQGHKMLLSEFMALGLWRFDTVPKGFIGTREASEFALAVNFLPHKRGLVEDKLLFDGALRGLGFPVPDIQAIFGAKKLPPPLRALGHKGVLARFLRQEARFPVFGKPLSGQNSKDVFSIEGYDPETDQLIMTNGTPVPLERVIGQIAPAHYRAGYLFQSRIRQHPALGAAENAAVGTVRVITFLAKAKPRIIGAFWKIPRAGMVADNLWRGGLLATVDCASGRVGPARAGLAPVPHWHKTHPDTDAQIAGLELPDWSRLCRQVREAAGLLAGLPLVGWDVAMGETGPIIIEANTVPSIDLLQYGSTTPALPPDLRTEIRAEAARLKHQAKASRTARTANRRVLIRARLSRAFGLGR